MTPYLGSNQDVSDYLFDRDIDPRATLLSLHTGNCRRADFNRSLLSFCNLLQNVPSALAVHRS